MASPFEMSSRSLNESRPGRDDVIRGTDDDAFISKLSAVNLGYLDDPFVKHFVKRPSRRPPIINRGSYLRTTMLDNLMANFLKNDSRLDQGSSTGGAASSSSTTTVPLIKKQIVSLGCGSDTRYFKLKANGLSAHKYFEIDFAESTAKKAITIKKNKKLLDIIADPDHKLGLGGTEFYSKDYSLLSGDLREFVDSIVPKLKAQGFDTSLPTLFLSECVLIYIQPRDSDDIVDWVGTNMDAALFVVYEQINPSDPFGAMMLRNLKARQIELPGIHAYPSLKSQEERFMSRGWISAKAVDMNTLHDSISEAEMKRISALEIFDEVEEWQLLAQHYCIAWAYNVKKDLGSPPRHDQSQASGQEQLLEAGRLSIQSGYDRSLIISLFAKAVQ
ncbi:hypothetical protein BGW38_005520 [Lunasporangiospora selenospora]|uniref:Leucine carboxyl methyltransferase 1 n=1 Tax=Lunasporangiospora selenospora TaxID=979761 RepID=A0A9P6FMY6_9FUNG|nr:hypothetical protein BGW38_005520 [Lunasporangiospora selenospora]